MLRNMFLLLPFVLMGCSGFTLPWQQVEGLSPEQQIFSLAADYSDARASIEAFAQSGPLCSEADLPGCVSDRAVIALDDITDRLDPVIAAATLAAQCRAVESEDEVVITTDLLTRLLVRCEGVSTTDGTLRSQVSLARGALLQLTAALAQENVDA